MRQDWLARRVKDVDIKKMNIIKKGQNLVLLKSYKKGEIISFI